MKNVHRAMALTIAATMSAGWGCILHRPFLTTLTLNVPKARGNLIGKSGGAKPLTFQKE